MSSDTDTIMTIVGTIGGFAISLSLVPQIYLTYKTKCADDISYYYQAVYIFGAALVNTYAIYAGLYAVYIPCLLEFSLIITLTVMKFMYPPRLDLTDQIKEVAIRHSISVGSAAGQSSLQISRHNRKSVSLLKSIAFNVNLEDEIAAMEDEKKEEEKADELGQSQDDKAMEY
jgi:uncharacterized protein with PQ loop repeat